MLFKYLMTIILSAGFFLPGFSQYSVKVMVLNSDDNHLILNPNFVLRKQNEVQKFIKAAANGRFELKGLTAGRFSLLLTCIGYEDYSAEFELGPGNPVVDLGRITLLMKTNLLKEVRILGTVDPIRIKGDTTEYHALAFRSNANDKVENLLKQLPGISVDKDGKLTAQGRTIDKVLVDGQEFFGDDPTLATRNIRTDMVDKIQVYEKKSDLAALIGRNDGKGLRTINIKLKADKKKGYFGKIEAGMGTGAYAAAQLMGNYFSGQQRISVYGVAGNNGATSLSWQDNAKYASSNVDVSVPGYMIDLGGYDELESRNGNYNGQGIPVARTSGLHYENKWNKNENSVNFNYKIGALKTSGTQEISTQNSLPSGLVSSSTAEEFSNEVFRQKLDGRFDLKLGKEANLKITLNGGLKNIAANKSAFSSLLLHREDSVLLMKETKSFRYLSEDSKEQHFMISALYLRKLKRERRTFSIGLRTALEQRQMNGQLRSNTTVSQMDPAIENIDQDKTSRLTNQGLYMNATYSEPISKSLLLLLNYGLGGSNNQISRFSFDRLNEQLLNTPDPLYSNDFELGQLGQEARLSFSLAKQKILLNFGSKGSLVAFKQRDRPTKNQSDRSFLLWHPQLNFQYTLSPQRSIRFNYEGNAAAPAIAKLQPVLINDDPLNISQGNPLLKPSFSQTFFVGYQSYHPDNGELIGVFANYGTVMRPIVNKTQTDTAGKTFTQFTNLQDLQSRSLNLSLFYDRRVKALDMSVGLNFNVNGNTSYNLSNEVLNKLDHYTYKLQMRFSKLLPNAYEFNLSFGPAYTVSAASLQPDYRSNGKGFLGDGNVTVYLPFRLQMMVNAAYQYLGKTALFDQGLSRMMLNASISKVFFKENALKLSLSGSDLLNQNVGFNRSISGYLISQRSYTVIKRYFMLGLTYDLNKMTAQ